MEGRAKEQSAAERSKLQMAYDETRKEMAVQKALADGWARDVKVRNRAMAVCAMCQMFSSKCDNLFALQFCGLQEIQAKLKAEQASSAALQQRLFTLSKRNAGEDDKHTDMIKSIATMEQVCGASIPCFGLLPAFHPLPYNKRLCALLLRSYESCERS